MASTISRGAAAFVLLAADGRVAGAAEAPDERDQAKPCRPTITCTADIVAPGDFEVEVGGAYAHGDGLALWTFPVLLKQSFTSWLQLQVGSNGYTLVRTEPHTQYLDNVFVGPKFHLVDQTTFVPSLALSAQVSVPTLAVSGYDRETDLFFVAYASKDFGPIHADSNAGVNVWRIDDSARGQAFATLVLSTALPVNLDLEAEVYLFSDAGSAAKRDGGLRGAVTFSPRSWLVLDAGADAGFFPWERAITVFAGVTVIPVVFWHPARPAQKR